MSAHLLATGVLSGHPERVAVSATKRRPLFRGALVFQTDSGGWWPANFATWSTTVAEELARLEKGDAVAFQARLSLGAYQANGAPAVRIHLQIEKLIALPKPKRARPSFAADALPADDDTGAKLNSPITESGGCDDLGRS